MPSTIDYLPTETTFFLRSEEVPVYLTVYSALSDDMPESELNMSARGTHNIYALRLSKVTTRQLVEFCAAVYQDLPELKDEPEEQEEATSEVEGVEEAETSEEPEDSEEAPEEDFDEDDTPSVGPAKKLKRKTFVERTSSSAVTVETD